MLNALLIAIAAALILGPFLLLWIILQTSKDDALPPTTEIEDTDL